MIILYHPRAAEERYRIPMSLLALASTVVDAREVVIVDGDLVADPVAAIEGHLARAGGRALLGVSVMPGPQLSRAIPHCRTLRQRHPSLTILWGGWFPSLHPDTCLSGDIVDYVLRERAEQSFPTLLSALEEGGDLGGVPGLSYRDASGGIHHNPKARPDHPDKQPLLPYHLIDPAAYHCDTWLGRRTTAYHSSYGCPLTCGFCAVAAQYKGGWVGESVPRMMANIEVLLRHGADAIELCDNNFFVGEPRTVRFAEAMSGRGVSWWGEGTIDDLLGYSDRSLKAMRASGLKMVFMGAESGSDEVLARMNKGGLAAERSVRLAARMRDHDIVPEFSFVLGNPPEPRKDIDASIALIRRIKAANPQAEIILYVYSPEPYPGSELWEQAVSAGFTFPTTLDEWERGGYDFFSMRRQKENPWLGRDDLKRIRDFEVVLQSYYPSISDTRLGPWARRGLRLASAARYRSGRYAHPWGLKALLKAARLRPIELEGLQLA